MEGFLGRFRNPIILIGALFIQIIGLATQVRRPADPMNPDGGGTRLLRVWAVNAAIPFQKAFIGTGQLVRGTWNDYVDLRGARERNEQLQQQVNQLRLDQVRLSEDAAQARRLQALFEFKEQYVNTTVPAQVIGTSGTTRSRSIFIDKGSNAGITENMPVITPDGVVGKIIRVYGSSAQILLMSDQESGVGAMLESSRTNGIVEGTPSGALELRYIMADEPARAGEKIVTSGGDRVFPKGFPVGIVTGNSPDPKDPAFQAIHLKPAANLSRLEEVLVVTRINEKVPDAEVVKGTRAADILASRLPSVPPKEEPKPKVQQAPAQPGRAAQPPSTGASSPQQAAPVQRIVAPPQQERTQPDTSETSVAAPPPEKKPATDNSAAAPSSTAAQPARTPQ